MEICGTGTETERKISVARSLFYKTGIYFFVTHTVLYKGYFSTWEKLSNPNSFYSVKCFDKYFFTKSKFIPQCKNVVRFSFAECRLDRLMKTEVKRLLNGLRTDIERTTHGHGTDRARSVPFYICTYYARVTIEFYACTTQVSVADFE